MIELRNFRRDTENDIKTERIKTIEGNGEMFKSIKMVCS